MIKRTPEEQSQLVGACRSSGKAVKAWCHENSISYSTYMGWARLLAEKDAKSEAVREPVKPPPAVEPEAPVKWAAVEPAAFESRVKTDEPPQAAPCFAQTRETRAQIRLSRGDWAINVEGGFNAGLLADVMRVVNAICC